MAAAKLPALLAAGAQVTVVAPEIRPEISSELVALSRREFRPEDLDGAFYVIAAAPPEVNRAVAAAAEERRVFLNAVDDVSSASVFLGGVLRREGVTVAISTDGVAPALAGLIREALDALLPEDLSEWITTARALRSRWKAAKVPMRDRRPDLLDALNRIYAERANRGAA